MAWEAIVTLLTLFTVLAALVIARVSADLVLMAALVFLLITRNRCRAVDCPFAAGPPENRTRRTTAYAGAHRYSQRFYEQYRRCGHVYPRHSGLGETPGYSFLPPSLAPELRRHSGLEGSWPYGWQNGRPGRFAGAE